MKEKRALVLASTASMIDQFNMSNISILKSLGYRVDVAANFSNPGTITKTRAEKLKIELINDGVCVYNVAILRNLNPKALLRAYKQVKRIVYSKEYSLLHCHSPIGSVIAREAAKRKRKEGLRILYTAHGFHFYKGAPLINWLLYYPVEKYYSRYTDAIITINEEDYKRAKEKLKAKETFYIPGVGVDVEKYEPKESDEEYFARQEKRKEIGVPIDAVLLMSVGELNRNKNHSVVIKALSMCDKKVHYAIAGKGEMKGTLEETARENNVSERVHILGYRLDIKNLYSAADICVFPSIREGLGLAAIEGMASGLPLIVADNRGTRSFTGDDNGIICDPKDVNAFARAINMLSRSPDLRDRMGAKNVERSRQFDYQIVNKLMKNIYSK